MKFEDLVFGKRTTLELQYERKAQPIPRPGDPVELRPEGSGDDSVVRHGASDFPVRPADAQNGALLRQMLERGCYRLCRVLKATEDRLILAVHEFPAELSLPEAISIGVDEKVIDLARQKRKQYTTVAEVVDWLNEEMVLSFSDPGDRYVFLTGTPGNRRDLSGAFRLVGNTVSVDVNTDSDGRLQVERVVYAQKKPAASEAQSIHLVRGPVRFVDGTLAEAFRGLAKDLIEQVVKEGESYLDLWNRYNEVERQIHIRKAREFGTFNYDSQRRLPNGNYEFTLSEESGLENFSSLADSTDTCLEAASHAPEAFGLSSAEEQPRERRGRRNFSASVVSSRRQRCVLKPVGEEPIEPPPQGVLFLSIRGDETRLNRREGAQKRIIGGASPMPQLGLILEGRHTPARRIKHEKAISPAAKEAFRGEPTERQRKALDVALNSPDVVLIQGPPGTGKTRVIAALQSRLAEIHGDHAHVAGRILLTSYQHDAVENVAEATEIFGLPAIKIGRKRDLAVRTDGFIRWLEDRKEAVEAQRSVIPKKSLTPIIDQINRLESSYRQSYKSYDDVGQLLTDLESAASAHLRGSARDQLEALKGSIGSNGRPGNVIPEAVELALRAIRGLRTDSVSFGDDGPDQAYKALRRLRQLGELHTDDEKLLETLQELDSGVAPELEVLNNLKTLQERWIDQLTAKENVQTRQAGPNVEVLALVSAIRADLREQLALDPAEGLDAALHEYQNDLNDEEHMRKTIEHYSSALAATCQQAVGKEMVDLKGDTGIWPTFEYVIVDEAARANPLDLLIPMALAERKIILVGDHRQLPHLLEAEIEHELETAVEGSSMREKVNSVLRESLFERLFKLMREREAKDGIVRTVTLDCQYRMHPVLGQFVSDTFYHPYGESFSSGRTEEEMAHEVQRYHSVPAAWVDLPRSRGQELKGISKARPVEAEWVAGEAMRIVEAHPHYSVGVITFYRHQVDRIFEELEKNGFAERDENGQPAIAAAYRQTRDSVSGKLKERLRVGTVDAFQGKEFDVVLLSMVRSNDLPVTEDLKSLRRKYGHLMLENRLCVGMSRQQRLLIVCGDAGMLEGEKAQEAVPGLIAFNRLCSEKGKVIRV